MNSTVISWGLTVSLIGVAVYVYRPDLLKGSTSQALENKLVANEPPKPSAKKAKTKKPASKTAAPVVPDDPVSTSNNSSDTQGSKKRKIIPAPADKNKTATTTQGQKQQQLRSEDDGLSDKDFAKQLAMAQSGNKLQAPPKQQVPPKDRRAAKLAPPSKSEPSGFSTEASSTAGRDADDDLTPGESPETRPADGPVSRAGDVSDMLEAPGAKPTTLRLTDVSNDSKPKKAASKNFEPVLSKKKRNEKQRKEEQRLLREESERVHEAKKQEQLRTARMAAGTSNQTKANNFAAKANNAWQGGAANAVKDAPAGSAMPLLDTFEPSLATTIPSNSAVHTEPAPASNAAELKAHAGEGPAAALTASARERPSQAVRQEFAGDLSEEDQMKILTEQQQEDAWESVTTKKSKRKGKQDSTLIGDTSSPTRAQTTPAPAPAPAPVNIPKANGTQKKVETVNRFTSFQDNVDSGLQDAEWEA